MWAYSSEVERPAHTRLVPGSTPGGPIASGIGSLSGGVSAPSIPLLTSPRSGAEFAALSAQRFPWK